MKQRVFFCLLVYSPILSLHSPARLGICLSMTIDTETTCPVCAAEVVEFQVGKAVDEDKQPIWHTIGRFQCGLVVKNTGGVLQSCINATQLILDLRAKAQEQSNESDPNPAESSSRPE